MGDNAGVNRIGSLGVPSCPHGITPGRINPEGIRPVRIHAVKPFIVNLPGGCIALALKSNVVAIGVHAAGVVMGGVLGEYCAARNIKQEETAYHEHRRCKCHKL